METLKNVISGVEPGTLTAFVGYLILMVIIGALFCKKSKTLDDYLLGDKYFKVNYEGHNLVRTRCQLHLVRDMLAKYDEMCAIIQELTKESWATPKTI